MSPDASRWRSAEAYDYLDDLSPADLAWEYLRRNHLYQADYDARATSLGDDAWLRSWGLRFPHRSCA